MGKGAAMDTEGKRAKVCGRHNGMSSARTQVCAGNVAGRVLSTGVKEGRCGRGTGAVSRAGGVGQAARKPCRRSANAKCKVRKPQRRVCVSVV